MYPKLFDLGPLSIYTCGLLLAAAFLVGLQVGVVRGERRGIDRGRMMDLGIYIIVSAFIGAKLLLVLVDFDHFAENPGDLFSLARSGGVFYGGLILATVVAIWYVRRHRLPVWHVADAAAPGIALGHVVGRLGCFLGGCCYGHPTDVPWAVTFTDPQAAANVGTPLGIPLHPTQLYEAGAELLILGGLLWFERKGRSFPGRTFFAYLIVYAISRFVIEFYRGDPRGFVFGWISTSQFISLLLVPIAIVMLWWLSHRPQPAASGAVARTRQGHAQASRRHRA
jgi:phosphatidylglycerol:prolipoprotein diacylglycerol transferase